VQLCHFEGIQDFLGLLFSLCQAIEFHQGVCMVRDGGMGVEILEELGEFSSFLEVSWVMRMSWVC